MKTRILFTLITLVFAVLILSMQNPVILAGGSDSSEVIVAPGKITQWLTLTLFFVIGLLPAKLLPLKKPVANTIKFSLLTFSLLAVLVSGHTYRYSGRAHALIDSWFYIPIQRIAMDPNSFAGDAHYRSGALFVQVIVNGEVTTHIMVGPAPLGIDRQQVTELLESFGIESQQR